MPLALDETTVSCSERGAAILCLALIHTVPSSSLKARDKEACPLVCRIIVICMDVTSELMHAREDGSSLSHHILLGKLRSAAAALLYKWSS